MKSVKVSAVVPVYNTAPYLRQCLDTLCGQTLEDIEILCVDDGSTDGSLDILYEYEKKHPQVRVLLQKEDSDGASLARNMGIEQAQGEYLLIVDSDDYYSLELAKKTYQRAMETNADVVVYDITRFDNLTGVVVSHPMAWMDFPLLGEKLVFSKEDYPEKLLQIINSAMNNKLVKRSFVEQYHIRFQSVCCIDDVYFTYTALALANKITFLSDSLMFYRTNNQESQIQNLDRDPLAPIKVSLKLKETLETHGLWELLQETFLKRSFQLCQNYFYQLKDWRNFQRLYEALGSGALEELGLLSPMAKAVLTKEQWEEIQLIAKNQIGAYFYGRCKNKDLLRSGILDYEFSSFCEEIPLKKIKVILYGAGKVGKSLFSQNMLLGCCDIVAWVDRNYENIGFPVTGLDTFQKVEFDKVIIAIELEEICAKVAEQLKEFGVPSEKIACKK